MKNLINKAIFGTLILSLAFFGFIVIGGVSAQNNQNVGASGQGSLPDVTQGGKTVKRQFSFSAHRNADGVVSGNATLHNPAFTGDNGQKYQLQIDISCMKIVGNVAFFGGTTRRTNDSNLIDAVYFAVQDNGEPGKNNDKISRVYFFDDDPTTTGDPQLCQNNTIDDFVLETIISGNINLRGENSTE